ncbi:unnamed protein product, partial [Cylicostephanus goldi]
RSHAFTVISPAFFSFSDICHFCFQVKQVTESDGTVSGTLLVTPNCLMFDPDVTHPLVKENGQDLYGMVANMDEIVSVSVYKDVGALTGDKAEKKRDIFDPNHVRTEPPKSESVAKIINLLIEQGNVAVFSKFSRKRRVSLRIQCKGTLVCGAKAFSGTLVSK